MSDQGELPDRGLAEFGLIETLLWTRDEGFFLLDEHLARIAASAARLGFRYDEAKFRGALECAVKGAAARLRVRIVLKASGELESGATEIEPQSPGRFWRVALARRRFSSADPLLRHKTTRREIYEGELAASGADEVLFLNERDEVCEGARTNVFLPRGGKLLTPPVGCGLLPGTLRAHLMKKGEAVESVLRLEDFERVEFFMGNSVRGLVRARFTEPNSSEACAANVK